MISEEAMPVMRVYHLPCLSSWNGPAALPHVLRILDTLGVPTSYVRLLPMQGHFAHREILPYHETVADQISPQGEDAVLELRIRLGVNVGANNRLARFAPLIALGLPSPRWLSAWRSTSEPLACSVRRWYTEQFLQRREPRLDSEVSETPVERLARQLCEYYHEFQESESEQELPSTRLLIIRQQKIIELLNDYTYVDDYNAQSDQITSRLAQEFAEIFFTNTFIALALADLLGGFEFELPLEPEGCPIPVRLNARSRIEDVVRWLRTYPHYPLESLTQVKSGRPPDHLDKEPPDGKKGTDDEWSLWSEQDPAVEQLFSAIREQYAKENGGNLTPAEMLALVRRYLPEYIPCTARQSCIYEGINLRGALLTLMHIWWQRGDLLGISPESMEMFTPEEKVVLEMLILLRHDVADWFSLLQTALRLLVHPAIKAELVTHILAPSRLGTPFAQLQKTLVIGTVPMCHAPQVTIHIPLDRTEQQNWIAKVENKLMLLTRLFVPAHLPVHYQWSVDWAVLGKTAYLKKTVPAGAEPATVMMPTARLMTSSEEQRAAGIIMGGSNREEVSTTHSDYNEADAEGGQVSWQSSD